MITDEYKVQVCNTLIRIATLFLTKLRPSPFLTTDLVRLSEVAHCHNRIQQ